MLTHGAAAQKDVEAADAVEIAAKAEINRAEAKLKNYGGGLDSLCCDVYQAQVWLAQEEQHEQKALFIRLQSRADHVIGIE